MNRTRPELGFERLLRSLERDLLEATDAEILTVANELGIKPGMKGSIALIGVISTARPKDARQKSARQTNKVGGSSRSRGRPKGDEPAT